MMPLTYLMSVISTIHSTGPTVIPATMPGLTLWLDAADTTSLVISNNKVAEWHDKSGNQFHAAQTTPSLRATHSTSVFAPGAIGFDSNQGMLFPSITLTGAATIFMVVNWITGDAYRSIGLASGPNIEDQSVDRCVVYSTTLPSFPATRGSMDLSDSSSRYIQSQSNTVPAGPGIFEYVASPIVGQSAVLRNGTSFTSNEVGINWNIQLSQIGGQSEYLGNGSQLAEVIVYQGALTPDQRNSVRTYLSNKWSIVY